MRLARHGSPAAETGAVIPAEPIIFLKTPDTVVGPDDEVLIPRKSTKTDWEVELAVVIGAQARYLDSPADAWRCIAGYAISDDVSEREFQLERGGQWDKGKMRPGDVINTGTPAGVALGRADKPYLRAGDVVEAEIDGLGRQRHTFGQA